MAEVDFHTTITALDGVTAQRFDGGNKVAKLKDIAINCLLGNRPGEEHARKLADADLAEKIGNGKTPVDLCAEDVSRIKKLIGDMQPPLIMKRCWDILDPRAEEE